MEKRANYACARLNCAKITIFFDINAICVEKLCFKGVERGVFKGFEGGNAQYRVF